MSMTAAGLALSSKIPAYLLVGMMSCTQAPPPTVSIAFNNQPYRINNTVTLSQLQQIKSDTTFSRLPTENFKTVGTAVSGITASLDAQFKILSSEQAGQTCLWMSDAKVIVTYAPEILIVRDYQPSTCRYRTTMEHELRHVNTDIITLNEFLPVIKNAVQIRASQLGTLGPFDSNNTKMQQQMMHQNLQQTLKLAVDRMMQVRQLRQQQIDTRAEYLRLSGACPGEPQAPGMP